MDDSYPGIVGATVFVNVTTKLSAVPRLTRHSLKFHREIAPQARWATEGGACVRARARACVCVCVCVRVWAKWISATLPIARARGLITRGQPGDTKAIRGDRSVSSSLSLLFSPAHFPPLHARIIAIELRLQQNRR